MGGWGIEVSFSNYTVLRVLSKEATVVKKVLELCPFEDPNHEQ